MIDADIDQNPDNRGEGRGTAPLAQIFASAIPVVEPGAKGSSPLLVRTADVSALT